MVEHENMEQGKQQGQSSLKKLKYFLLFWNGFWSIPLSFLAFFGLGILGQYLFGEGVGFYDPSFWQAALLATGEFLFFNSIAFFTLRFCFRHLWKYYKGNKEFNVRSQKLEVSNRSKDDFDNLQAWQKLFLLVFLYCFFIAALVSLYKAHV
ncbi:MAG: hypothetical protein IPM92_16070 [Saprospiraceae bacterium]|nr:hypothetical protein [Saprospiraceae bacterium]